MTKSSPSSFGPRLYSGLRRTFGLQIPRLVLPLDKCDIKLYIHVTMLIPTSQNTKTISDLRKNPLGLLTTLEKSGGPQYIFYRANPRAVMINISDYIDLIKNQEDYFDSLMAKKYEKEDKKKTKWLTQKDFEKAIGL